MLFTNIQLDDLSTTLSCLLEHLSIEEPEGREWSMMATVNICYRLSKRPNCFRGTCSGLGTWRPRCTKGALSGTRHVVPSPSLSLIALVTAPLSGTASPMTPASSMTRASALAPVPFPQLSPHVPSYCPITPNPCALGQQVTIVLSRLIVSPRLVYFYPDHS